MEESVAENTDTELVATTPLLDSNDEQKLTDEIMQLWAFHTEAKTVVKRTKAELKIIRERLSESLYQMKQLLARPGRNGQWSPWLKQQKINRASADRLVRRFEASLPGHELTQESISEPTEADIIRSLYKVVWLPIQKVLTTQRLALIFLAGIAKGLDVRCEWRNEGLMLFRPDAVAATAATTQSTADTSAGGAADASGSQVM